jgi:hypothetical protein
MIMHLTQNSDSVRILQSPHSEHGWAFSLLWFILLVRETAIVLWKEWPREMEAHLINVQARQFTLAGVCPHCRRDSAFMAVTNVHNIANVDWVVGMQCQGCMKFILAIVRYSGNTNTLAYLEHYPLGKPDDSVDLEIPEHIQSDFKEALRCLWVNAYNATAEMCRRAVEASCIDLGAQKKKVLDEMIDWLEDQRIITPFLQQVAHKIRLGGNRGAHPEPEPIAAPTTGTEIQPEDAGPITKIGKEHAEAMVKFTREFFHHVYVVPKQLDKYDFSKPKTK